MFGEAGCIVCCQPRVLKALFPVAQGVELKLYECDNCDSTMWLIANVTRRGKEASSFTTIDAALKTTAIRAERS